jgi:hypothetical protein
MLEAKLSKSNSNKLNAKAMENEEPPRGNFIYLLPLDILGYNMVEKKWGTKL